MIRKAFGVALAVAPMLLHCGPALPPPAPTSAQPAAAQNSPGALAPGEPDSLVPVEADDAVNGNPDALVTLVAFLDYECPFCAAAHGTLTELRRRYSPADLRIVFKHAPLPFHDSALPAARAAQTVLDLAGERAFEHYSDTLFSHRLDLTDENLLTWATAEGVDPQSFKTMVVSARVQAEVDHDLEIAHRLGETATPSFRINGIEIVGARPLEVFEQVIDEQIEQAQALVTSGTPRRQIYPLLVAKNRDTKF